MKKGIPEGLALDKDTLHNYNYDNTRATQHINNSHK